MPTSQKSGMDIHEILFTRGDVVSADDNTKLLIHTYLNCGLVHSSCHHSAQTRFGRERSTIYLLRYEGSYSIMQFVSQMEKLLKDVRIQSVYLSNAMRELRDATIYYANRPDTISS